MSPEAIGLPGCWQVIAVQRESLDSGEPETEENLALMRWLGELHLEHPVYGNRKLTSCLRREGLAINRKQVVRLLRLMGIAAIHAKPRTSLPAPGHQI